MDRHWAPKMAFFLKKKYQLRPTTCARSWGAHICCTHTVVPTHMGMGPTPCPLCILKKGGPTPPPIAPVPYVSALRKLRQMWALCARECDQQLSQRKRKNIDENTYTCPIKPEKAEGPTPCLLLCTLKKGGTDTPPPLWHGAT